MNDFIDFLLTFLLGACIGGLIGIVAVAMSFDKDYPKFCPQCGDRFKNEETYCQHDGTELLTIGN